jgi:predicted GIY-YIG superfamily endonuclease
MFYFYIFRCEDQALYCGSTNDTQSRQERHNSGRGAFFVKSHGGRAKVTAAVRIDQFSWLLSLEGIMWKSTAGPLHEVEAKVACYYDTMSSDSGFALVPAILQAALNF